MQSVAMQQEHGSGELLLIRHAQSAWNASGRWQGHADPPLSPLGRQQAAELATSLRDELAGEEVTLLVCSDLKRALETAEAVGAVLGLKPEPSARYRELDVGRWSGLTREQIQCEDAALLERFEDDDPDARPVGGETRREIRARAHEAVLELVRAHPGERIALVTHLGFMRALLPGVEPANGELLRVSARDALSRRSLHEKDERARLRVPL